MDPITALLTIPQTMAAIWSLADGIGSRDVPEAPQLKEKIKQLQLSLAAFSHVYDDVQKWKLVHHVTQQICYVDLKLTLSISRLDADEFEERLRTQREMIQVELERLNSINGEVGKLTLSPAQFHNLPSCSVINASGFEDRSWIEFIVSSCTEIENLLAARQYTLFRDNANQLNRSCQRLNYIADQEMRAAVDNLLSDLVRFRERLAHDS